MSSPYLLDGAPITSSFLYKDLGVMVSGDLCWSSHHDFIISKAYKQYYMIRRSFRSLNSVRAKRLLYTSLITPSILYGSPVWRPQWPLHQCDVLRFERLQRHLTKYILNDYCSDYKSRLIALKLLPLTMVFELQDIMFLVKCLKFSHDYISQFISFSTSNGLRSSTFGKLKVHHCRLNCVRNSYFNRVVKLWNSLPIVVDLSLSLSSIKDIIFDLFWSKFLSSFDINYFCSFHYSCQCAKCFITFRSNYCTL